MSEWISVKNKLPLEGELVLVYYEEDGDNHIDLLVHELDGYFETRSCFDFPVVTHWMPLPKPPSN